MLRKTQLFTVSFLALGLAACSVHTSAQGGAKSGADAKSDASSSSKSSSTASASASAKANSDAKAKADAKNKASSSATANNNTKTQINVSVSGDAKANGKSDTKSDVDAKAKADGKVAASGKLEGSAKSSKKVVFESKGRVKGVKASSKAKTKTKVSADAALLLAKLHASGSAKGSISVKGSGSASGSGKGTSTKDPKDTKPPVTKDPKDTKPPVTKDPKDTKPPVTKDPKPTPTPVEPAPPVVVEPTPVPVPIDPPAEPPENDFGYSEPVKGCFEGLVYPIAANSSALPTNWASMTPISVVYACEWDIPVVAWSQGFPGVTDHFEWFAIRYSGTFNVAQPGEWTFRNSADDGAKLYIDGKVVLDNDGVHAPTQKTSKVTLGAGDHEMVLEYFQGPRYHINLQLYATPPGGQEGIFSVR